MDSIGASIFNGILGAALHALGSVPWTVWIILAVGICASIVVIRVVTEWKIALAIVILAFLGTELMALRAHWIEMGMSESGCHKIENTTTGTGTNPDSSCSNGDVFDSTQGKCVSQDGS